MLAEYPARYRDRRGDVATSLFNDGQLLAMVVRNVTFRGDDFDALEPADDSVATEQFTLHDNCLCSCTIETDIPIPVLENGHEAQGRLTVHLELGDPAPNGGIDREWLRLTFHYDDKVVQSSGTSGWFEDELLDIQKRLPEGSYLKACITCAFSDYSPAGHGLFGGLACFRDNKAAYLAVNSKQKLFAVWNSMTGFVQETYLCPEFERRTPGAGYRG